MKWLLYITYFKMAMVGQVFLLVTSFCSITDYSPNQNCFKTVFIISLFLWVRSPHVAWPGPQLQGLSQVTGKVLPRAVVITRLLGKNPLLLLWVWQCPVLRGLLDWGLGPSPAVGWGLPCLPPCEHRQDECCRWRHSLLWLITEVTAHRFCHILLVRSVSPVHT